VRKTSYTHNGSAWIEDADLLFVYDDWNVVWSWMRMIPTRWTASPPGGWI
jgi:hypothetical protein